MSKIYVTTKPVKHSPDGFNVIVWPVGTEVEGKTGESLERQGKAKLKPARKPSNAKVQKPSEAK